MPVQAGVELTSHKNAANGYAGIDATSRIAKAQAHSATVYNDQNNALGAFYEDHSQIAAPANPAAGTRRVYVDSGTGKLSVRTSAGASVSLEEQGGGGGGDVYLGQTNTYGDFDSIFRSSRIKLRNPANTQSYSFVAAAIAASRNITLPLLTGNDTMVTEAFIQSLTNKTIDVSLNTLKQTTPALGALLKDNGTNFAPLAKGSANQILTMNAGGTDFAWAAPAVGGGGNVSTGQINTYGDFDQIFRSSRIKLRNPADTQSYSFIAAAIAAGRNITLPLLTADDTMVTQAFTQPLTNKTIDASSNTVSNIVDANIGAHTSTKITITDKTHLNTAIVYNDANNAFGAFYHDVSQIAAPANPAAGTRRIYMDSGTGKLSVRTSAGTSVSLEEQASADANAAHVNTDNVFGAHYEDLAQIAAPANPAAGTRRIFTNSATGKLSVRTSAGTSVSLEEQGGAGGGGGSYYLYTVYQDSGDSLFKCKNNLTGAIDSSNANAQVVLQYAVTNASNNGTVFVQKGYYPIATTISVPEFVTIVGEGREVSRIHVTADNVPALTFTATTRGCLVEKMFFTHASATYTSALLLFQDGCNSNEIRSCDFYDYDTWAGTAIEFSNTAANGAGLGIFFNRVVLCDFYNFLTTIKYTITQGGWNWVNGNDFIGCVWHAFRTGVKMNGVAETNIDKNNFTDCEMQSDGASSLCGFDYSDAADHNYNTHVATMVWDLTAGNKYAKLNAGTELALFGCFPDSDDYITIVDPTRFAKFGTYSGTRMNNISDIPQNPATKKRTGSFIPVSSAATTAAAVSSLDGCLTAHTPTGAGTNTSTYDTTEGLVTNFVASGTGQNVGLVSPVSSVGMCRTLFGGRAVARCKMDSVTSARFFVGFVGVNALPISDTPMASAMPGILVGYSAADTNWQIYHNDNVGTVTKTVVTGPIAKDALYHTIEINWPADGASINVLFDGVLQSFSTNIPANTQDLWFNCVGQTSSATPRIMTSHGVWVEYDK